jgi:NADH-quinone oxidoreductase subunit E
MPIGEKMKIHSEHSQEGAGKVVVIDDEESMREACRQTLEAEGWSAAVAENGAKGLEILRKMGANVVLLDLKMPGMSGTEVLQEIPNIDPSISIIIMTGYGTIDIAVDAMKSGAFDFLAKPFDPDRVIDAVRRGLERNRYLKEAAAEDSEPEQASIPWEIAKKMPLADRQNILLKGLEALGEYYEFESAERNFFDELKYMEAEATYHAESLGQIEKKEKAVREIVHDIREVDEIIERYEYKKSALQQILLDIQKQVNWLPHHLLVWVSRRLNISLAEILTIANFYEAFSLEPRGKHIIQGCTGTACHVRGAKDLLTRTSSVLGIGPGESDPELQFTFKTVHCMGCCALAPVLKIDEEYYSNPSTRKLEKILTQLQERTHENAE